MRANQLKAKTREWLHRYIPAEVLGTILALIAAWTVFTKTHSFAAAAAAGWTGEGVGFYGYFITSELRRNAQFYKSYSLAGRISRATTAASTNLLIEFMPAEILDNFLIRPFVMFALPQLIHPYPVGFLAAKFSADIIFYMLAIVGYEARKRWLHR